MKIDVYPEYKVTNILFSGGMDSTILLYLLAKEIHQNNYDIKIICHAFGNNSCKENLKSITNYVQSRFNVKILLIIYRHKYWIRDMVKQILDLYGATVYSGCNKVVEDKFIPTKYIPHDTPPIRGPAYNDFHIRPFIDMNKIEIMDIYLKENLLELLKLTHSCGIHSDTPCGECYFCMERSWAATSLNVKDIT
jgi:7-cyano-7-deazaguanine synthase in queuosine biosynthesis